MIQIAHHIQDKTSKKQVQVPGMEGYLLHSLQHHTNSLKPLLPVPPPFLSRRQPGGHDHQSSRIAFLVHHAALNPGTERPTRRAPHYSSLHGHSWKHISNDYPPPSFFLAGLEEVAALVFTRRPVFVEVWARIAVGPNVNIWNPLVCEWSSADIFPFVSVARGKLVIETVLARITGVIFNITLFGLVEIYGAFKLRRCIVKICYLIIFSVEVRYVIIWGNFGKFAYIYIVNKNRFKIKTQFRF